VSDDRTMMSFTDHLTELRSRLVRVALALVLGFFACWAYRIELFGFLAEPISRALADNGVYHYHAIHLTESILVYLKTSFAAAILLTCPFTFYQGWSFVSPGLLSKERGFIIPVTIFTVIFFLIGAAFAYQVILPFITDWLAKLTTEGGQAVVMVTLQNAFSTALIFLVMFGLVFELPLVIFFLSLFGLVSARGLLRFFRYFVVLSFVASAMLTPPDPISQVLMALPLNVLYAFGILVAWGVERSRNAEGEGPSAGATLTRLMGASLLLLGLATFLVITFIRTLPQKDLVELVPEDAAWMVHANPSALDGQDDLGRAAMSALGDHPWLEALSEAGVDAGAMREAAVVGTDSGESAVLIRQTGLGLRGVTLPEESTLATARLDDDTIALGSGPLVGRIAAIADGRGDPAPMDDEDTRLIASLRTSGPLWAWLPNGEKAASFLGADLAAGATAAGASLMPGERTRFSLRLHGGDLDAAAALEVQLDQQRARAASSGAHDAELTHALRAVIREVSRGADPARQRALAGIESRLASSAEQPVSTIPAVAALEGSAAAWTLQRDGVRTTLSAELAPPALGPLLGRIGRALP
jgi:sec-independent protein translocase protein TatC